MRGRVRDPAFRGTDHPIRGGFFTDTRSKMPYNKDMSVSMDVLAQFNHLEKSGALDALANLRKENRELD